MSESCRSQNHPARVRGPAALVSLLVLCSMLACAGGAPLRVNRMSPDVARRSISANVVGTGQLSDFTKIVLRNHELMELHGHEPDLAIHALHEDAIGQAAGTDEYFALAELSFQYAEKLEHAAWKRARDREKRRNGGVVRKAPYYTSDETPIIEEAKSHYRAAAVYAYTFIFNEGATSSISHIDPRFRIAADVYSHSIVEMFTNSDGYQVFTAGLFDMPFGKLEVAFDEMELRWENRLLIDFLPSDDFEIKGLANRYRRPGFGAPLAARTVPFDLDDASRHLVARKAVVAVNAVLLFDEPREQLASGEVRGRLQITPATEDSSVEVGGQMLPLEVQPSVALAASLEESDVWEGRLGTFFGRYRRINEDNSLFGWEPRRKGQIPVVFIHGTMSTPVVWANMVNDLQSDPLIRERFQFLFYAYESGNPILYSSMLLRRSLNRAVTAVDPDEADACVRDMVLVGHSQGGLLAKGVSIQPGDSIWYSFFDVPIEDTKFNEATKSLLQEAAFIEPMPEVGRVVFISTPHRGSYVASSDLLRRLSAWAIRFPADLADMAVDASGVGEDDDVAYRRLRVRTSIDNMSPSDSLIQLLGSIPVSPEIPAHSIISVKPGQPIETGDDGVVKYRSAHIEEARSELVVRVSHSSQAHPKTIEEVRRILHRHVDESVCASAP